MAEESRLLFTMKVLNDYRKMKLSRGRDPGAIIERTMKAGIDAIVKDIKMNYITETETSGTKRPGYNWIGKQKGKLFKKTYGVTTRTSKYGTTGKIVIGEGLPYTKLHVGTMGREKHSYGTKGLFTIKLPVGVPWTSPKEVEGLFRGTTKNTLSSKILWKIEGGRPVPKYIVTKTIKIPQRVQTDEIMAEKKEKLMYSIRQAFGDLDVASLAAQVSGGIYESGAFGE